MCGIVGIVQKDSSRSLDQQRLVEMRDLLFHRGPDDAGIYVAGPVGLAHRRLSIIDLASGHQPMTNEDGSLWIVFNGEIYNFQSLRENLLAKGHRFATRSDTEVILHLYEEEGINCVGALNGIFAFAIWDARSQSLFLARDHVGVKPLYYASTPDVFVFSSEIKSILASGYLSPACREEAVFEYFVFRHVAGEQTLYRDVNCLLPGHTLLLKDGVASVRQYWSPEAGPGRAVATLDEATEELDTLLKDAVRFQLVSDVPLGTFCSGGVDSSLVTAYAARMTDAPINTFSVGFHERQYDETAFARLVASRYGTTHHEIRVGNKEFADLLPQMIWFHDLPLNFANSVQIYAVSKLAKAFVTVVLTGEGADELFGGYPRYLVPSLAMSIQGAPGWLGGLARYVMRHSRSHRLLKIEYHSRQSVAESLLYNASVLDPVFVRELLEVNGGDDLRHRRACLDVDAGRTLDLVERLALLDQRSYLVSILERQDKMSMAASVESRVPFLDVRLVEFANSLPRKCRVRGLRTKVLVKRVAQRMLPEQVVSRRKSGFGVPLREWLNDNAGLGRYVDELLVDRTVRRFVRHDRIVGLVREHRARRADRSEFLWTAINFMLWSRTVHG